MIQLDIVCSYKVFFDEPHDPYRISSVRYLITPVGDAYDDLECRARWLQSLPLKENVIFKRDNDTLVQIS